MTIEDQSRAAGANVAPRITPVDVEVAITSEHYFTGADGRAADEAISSWHNADDAGTERGPLSLLTICVLVLRNGFTVVGTSACASPENFKADIGREIARRDAVRQVWPLLGYQLRERLTAEDRGLVEGFTEGGAA